MLIGPQYHYDLETIACLLYINTRGIVSRESAKTDEADLPPMVTKALDCLAGAAGFARKRLTSRTPAQNILVLAEAEIGRMLASNWTPRRLAQEVKAAPRRPEICREDVGEAFARCNREGFPHLARVFRAQLESTACSP